MSDNAPVVATPDDQQDDVEEQRTARLRRRKSEALDVKTLHIIDEQRLLVNHVLGEIFDAEMAGFLDDGVFGHPGTLLERAKAKLLSFPPITKNKAQFEKSLDKVLAELPELIHRYSKATGKDWTKKLKKVVCGNLTLALVQDNATEVPAALMQNDDEAVAQAQDEHNYFQTKLLALFGLFLSGVEADGGIDVLMDRVRAYHSISELPAVYQLCFDGLRQYMRHSLAQIGRDKKKRKPIQRVMSVLPESAIVAVLRMNTGSKVMSGFSSLFLAKIGGQSLFQRVVAQRMDVPSVVAERDALVSKVHDKRLVNVLLDYIKERYPIDGGWKAFADKRKMVGVLIAHVTGDYSGVHAKKSEDVAMAKKKRTVKSLFKKKDKSEAGPVPDEKKQDNPIEGMEHLNVDATMPGINRSNSVNSTVSNTSQKSNRSISPGFKRSDVTVEEIGRVDDWTCGALFQVAVRELERYDLETLVQFSGSDPVTDFLAGLLKAIGSPLSDISRTGGMADLAESMFAMVDKALTVFSSTTTSEKRKMLELDAVLKEFMEAVYTFVHNAAVLDAGPLHETITWLLSSYVHSAEQVDLDEMMESLPSDKERAHVWQEIRSLDQYHKQKNKPQSQQQQQTEGVHTKPLKPALVVTSQLVPEMQKTLAKRLAGQSTAEDQDDLLAAAVQRSSVADLQLGASAAETGDTHEGKVVSHIAVCYDQQGVYALEKHGFAVCNETAEKKDKATYVMCKQATPLHNSILPITDMTVSNSRADETRLKLGGWVRVGKDLSKGSLFGTRINIWYKRGTTQEYSKAISDIQVVQEGQSPPDSSYELVDLNLNKNSIRGKAQHVWFTRKL